MDSGGEAFWEIRIAYVSMWCMWRSEIKGLVSGIICKSTVGGEGMSQESSWQPDHEGRGMSHHESESSPEPLIP